MTNQGQTEVERVVPTPGRIEWMKRAVVDINRNFDSMVRHYVLAGRQGGDVLKRKLEYEALIAEFDGKVSVPVEELAMVS